MKVQLLHGFEKISSVENLLSAWREFVKGKRSKAEVNGFSLGLMDHIMELHEDLVAATYKHGAYQAFNICDPKPRNIHKASVRDRLLHHAVYRVLYPFFDRTFIADSFSCRQGKGTHKAMDRFRSFARQASSNGTRTCWVLKCDIRKFFPSIDHGILLEILGQYIPVGKTMQLLAEIIGSFSSTSPGVGLPLGNLTSQLLVNIYMNEFDQHVKHRLKAKYYIRYADDFVFLSPDHDWLLEVLGRADRFLSERLRLQLHPNKVFLKTVSSGVDLLGWIHFPDHRILRTVAKRRMFARVRKHTSDETVHSYLGLLRHGNTAKLKNLLAEEVLLN